jgi:DNA-binding MarR family transcriptional regulator
MGQVEEDASFVVRSPHRTAVLQRLMEGAAIPAQIRKETGQEYSRITEAANKLRERHLIDLIVEEDTKRGRLYDITDRGEEAIQFMRDNGMLDEKEYRRR